MLRSKRSPWSTRITLLTGLVILAPQVLLLGPVMCLLLMMAFVGAVYGLKRYRERSQ
jgi:hypothetical protein